MNQLQVFSFEDNALRTIDMDGQRWFVLKDVCNVLDINQVSGIKRCLSEDMITNHSLQTLGLIDIMK